MAEGGFASRGAGAALHQPGAARAGLGFEQDPLPPRPSPLHISIPDGRIPRSLHFAAKGKRGKKKKEGEREEERRKNLLSESLYILSETITGTRRASL